MATELRERLAFLGEAAQYDLCSEVGYPAPLSEDRAPREEWKRYVTYVIAKGGRRMPVMKVLQTNACEKNCFYCPFRAGRDLRREALTPEELARAFDEMWRRGLVEGLFLSSGILGTRRTQDRMIATVELVRRKYGFPGYIHLKLLPDAEPAQIERAVQLADRVSVNLEAPNPERLALLAPKKDFGVGLVQTLRRAATYIRAGEGRYARAGETTQFVVGRRARLIANSCTPARCSTTNSAWPVRTIARSAPCPTRRSQRNRRRRPCVSIVYTRATSFCGATASAWTN